MKKILFPKKSNIQLLKEKRSSLFKKRTASKVAKRDVSVFGGPGSGRYPKGSGENPQAEKRDFSDSQKKILKDYNVTIKDVKVNNLDDEALKSTLKEITEDIETEVDDILFSEEDPGWIKDALQKVKFKLDDTDIDGIKEEDRDKEFTELGNYLVSFDYSKINVTQGDRDYTGGEEWGNPRSKYVDVDLTYNDTYNTEMTVSKIYKYTDENYDKVELLFDGEMQVNVTNEKEGETSWNNYE